jgi:predicted TIM-barrel fold metal-dependent hydrolase
MNYCFKSIKELSRLPYFSLDKDGKIYLKKGVLDFKIIDFHTHLGWNFILGKKINLWKKTEINYNYPEKSEIDLNRHGALDFGKKLNNKEKEIFKGIVNLKHYSFTYTIPNILGEMNRFQVEKSIILSVKIPLMANNTNNILKSIKESSEAEKRLEVFASINPKSLNKKKRLTRWVEKGVCGIKLHPLFNLFRPNVKSAYKIYKIAQELNLPIIFHTGLSPAAPTYLRRFVRINDYLCAIQDFPNVKFILGHGGGYSDWEEAIKILRKYENVYLENSGQSPKVISEFIKKVDINKILYGSDWPFYPMAVSIAKMLLATENSKQERKKLFYNNAQKLLNLKNNNNCLDLS